KKAFAAMMTAKLGNGTGTIARVQLCLDETALVLQKQPDHPYARDVAADCYVAAADLANGRGEDPEPLARKAITSLEPAVQRYPHFLWGLNDLALASASLGIFQQSRGNPAARHMFEKSLKYAGMAID